LTGTRIHPHGWQPWGGNVDPEPIRTAPQDCPVYHVGRVLGWRDPHIDYSMSSIKSIPSSLFRVRSFFLGFQLSSSQQSFQSCHSLPHTARPHSFYGAPCPVARSWPPVVLSIGPALSNCNQSDFLSSILLNSTSIVRHSPCY
jgi:hypothetical protein